MSRAHLLFKRRTIHAHRRFSVEYLGDLKLKYTCRTCGKSTLKDYKSRGTGHFSEQSLRKLAAYQEQGGGAGGVCQHCTKVARDKEYPLR